MRSVRGRNIRGGSETPPSVEDALWRMDLVYYVRRMGAIKIGYSQSLGARLRTLGCEWSDVVAVEFGGRDLERQRHEQFADLRITDPGYGVEHYRSEEPLLGHIAETMQATVDLVRARPKDLASPYGGRFRSD